MAGPLDEPARVLIVEDDASTRHLIREVCEGFGYRTSLAGDGEEALALAGEEPDLVLLDLMLPRMDGYAVLSRLRANPATRKLPVIVLTAVDDVEGKLRGIELGADDYVTKPFRIVDLQRRVEAILEKHRALGERRSEAPSRLDPLTGVGTYPELKERLSLDVARARADGSKLSALVIAVDDYPLVAEAIGADAAKNLVLSLAQVLRRSFRETDRIFRIDEEEFVALLPDTTCDGAVKAAERIVRALSMERITAAGEAPVTASVGIAEMTCVDAQKPDDLLRAAHRALELARRLGPARVEIATGV